MNPAEVEFLAENKSVQIIPNFSHDRLYLICGEVGPFRPGIPVQVPLWMAINLKQRQKCRLTAPEWMNVETLTQLKDDEAQSRGFTCMPDEHYMVTTQLILGAAPHDVANSDEIRTLVKDIWDMRIAKLRSSIDAFLKSGGCHAKLDHLTLMEINTVRPFLPHSLDQLFRLRQEKNQGFNQTQ